VFVGGLLMIQIASEKTLFDFDLMSLLPKADHYSVSQNKALSHVSSQVSRQLMILIGVDDSDTAVQAATRFYERINGLEGFSEVQFKVEESTEHFVLDMYSAHRYQMLSPQYRQYLLAGKGKKIQTKAFQMVYSPFAVGAQIQGDPFFLTQDFLLSLPLANQALQPENGVLMTTYHDKHYVFLSLILKPGWKQGLIQSVYDEMDGLKKRFPDVEIVASGIPFHTYAGTASAKREINILGGISLLGVIGLLAYVFRSFRPFLLANLTIFVGCLSAMAISLGVFGSIHILTVIFGTSLIGISIDYTFHYFSKQFYKDPLSGNQILKLIFPGITVGLITSLVGYVALLFTPFPSLRQIAVFSVVGLVSAYATVVLLYPCFPVKQLVHRPVIFKLSEWVLAGWKRLSGVAWLLMGVLGVVGMIGIFQLTGNDDIRLLYNPPKLLIENDQKAARILNQSLASQFYLVQGESAQEMLQIEEKLAEKLTPLIRDKKLGGYQALSQFIPSIQRQKQNAQLVRKNLIKPYLKSFRQAIGLSGSVVQNKNAVLSFEKWATGPMKQVVDKLYLGDHTSIVFLKGIQAISDLDVALAGVTFINRVDDISAVFKRYRTQASWMLVLIYLVIMVGCMFRYGVIKGVVIVVPSVVASLLSLGILGFVGVELNLFHVLALYLILGIGIDYALFYEEGRGYQMTTGIAVLLSGLTTLLAFGLLGFSATPSIQSFGVMTFMGIVFAYLLSPFVIVLPKRH